jgi:hypothetical protein
MTIHKHPLNILAATLFAAGIAWAATTPPTPPPAQPVPAPVAPPTTPTPDTPRVLWVYYEAPAPAWYILADFDTKDACTKALATVKATPPQQDQGCFRVGLDANHLHPDYEGDTGTPGVK